MTPDEQEHLKIIIRSWFWRDIKLSAQENRVIENRLNPLLSDMMHLAKDNGYMLRGSDGRWELSDKGKALRLLLKI